MSDETVVEPASPEEVPVDPTVTPPEGDNSENGSTLTSSESASTSSDDDSLSAPIEPEPEVPAEPLPVTTSDPASAAQAAVTGRVDPPVEEPASVIEEPVAEVAEPPEAPNDPAVAAVLAADAPDQNYIDNWNRHAAERQAIEDKNSGLLPVGHPLRVERDENGEPIKPWSEQIEVQTPSGEEIDVKIEEHAAADA